MRWADQSGPVHSLFYAGENYQGHATEVFAFYASPRTLGKAAAGKTKFPGVVLIHGGGGTAFAEWAWLWAKRGYAAIAMDLSGHRPNDPVYDPKTGAPVPNQAADRKARTRLPNGGPDQGHPEKFDTIGGDTSDDWPFHAAATVIRAHSLLRSFPEVDAEHTAVTGISWGGYTTCLVASLDDRFKAAVPVYGCGFLYEGESVQKPSIDKLGDRRQQWIDDLRSLQPAAALPRADPVRERHQRRPLPARQLPEELRPRAGAETDAHRGQHAPRPSAGLGAEGDRAVHRLVLQRRAAAAGPRQAVVEGDHIRLPVTSVTAIKEASLHYTTDTGLRSKRKWQSIPAEIGEGVIIAPRPPADANTWFISLTDERGAMVSSTVQFANQ